MRTLAYLFIALFLNAAAAGPAVIWGPGGSAKVLNKTGGLLLNSASAACTATLAGSLRWQSSTLEVCSGSAWGGVGGTTDATFLATFDGGVGEITIPYSKVGNTISIEIIFNTADPGAGVITAGAGSIPAGLRPIQQTRYAVIVTNNGAAALGSVTITADGSIIVGVGASGGAFTDNAAAAINTTITYLNISAGGPG